MCLQAHADFKVPEKVLEVPLTVAEGKNGKAEGREQKIERKKKKKKKKKKKRIKKLITEKAHCLGYVSCCV